MAYFDASGRPAGEDSDEAPLLVPMTPAGTEAAVLATCDGPQGEPSVLMRLEELDEGSRWYPRAYSVLVESPLGRQTIPIDGSWLFDPAPGGPAGGNVHMTVASNEFVLVSTNADRLRICRIPTQGTANAHTIQIGGPGTALPGIIRLRVASVHFDGAWFSVALTADLNLPGLGGVSVGARLRLSDTGALHPSFGESGLWVSPLTNQYREFICAGEFPGGVVGTQGPDVIAFGIAPSGDGLDEFFGSGEAFRQSLGGSRILSAVTASDGEMTYVFARLLNGTSAGCRFNRQGNGDSSFGVGGRAEVPSDGMPVTPNAIKIVDNRIMLAVTRQVEGLDCDRVPAIVVLDATTGQPSRSFGAGGFALHAKVGFRAAICSDGSSYYTQRRDSEETMQVRRANSAGHYERVITIPEPPGGASTFITQLCPLDSGGLLIAGNGGWFAKLTAAGTLDSQFGTNGIATPRINNAIPQPIDINLTPIIGVLPDGRIAIQLPELGVSFLHPDGTLDTAYAPNTNNVIAPAGFGYIAWPRNLHGRFSPALHASCMHLDADGSIVIALGSQRDASDPNIELALRRITPAGDHDPNFGLGPISLIPRANSRAKLFNPQGATDPNDLYTKVEPVGMAWLGGMLYVAVNATSGGLPAAIGNLPSSQVLVVVRWNNDGTADNTFGTHGPILTAHQEAGFLPARVDYRPVGMVTVDASRVLVYGNAGRVEQSVHGRPVIRRPQPALFRVTHPQGIDTHFGGGGADCIQMQEFEASTLTARLMSSSQLRRTRTTRIRFISADARSHPFPSNGRVLSNFGVIGQFALKERI